MKKGKEIYRGDERRKYIRYRIPFTFLYKKENENKEEASTTEDISLGGLRFITSKVLSDAFLKLEIWTPTSIGHNTKLRAKVVWQRRKNIFSREYETGVSFTEPEKVKKDLQFILEKVFKKAVLRSSP